MSNKKLSKAKVKMSLIKEMTVPEALSLLDNVCAAGAQCAEVLASPLGAPALDALQQAVTATHGALIAKQAAAQALAVATKVLERDFEQVKIALGAYGIVVETLASGQGTVINKAGLPARGNKGPTKPLEAVPAVQSKPGKHPREAVITWLKAQGATGYVLEVNVDPANPAGPWTALSPGTARKRVVQAPTPGVQILVRVAAFNSSGAQSPWSDAVLATAL
jgi:hypothetical protein